MENNLTELVNLLHDGITVDSITDKVRRETGIDPTTLYCSITGKPFGVILDDEISAVCDLIGYDDESILVDELYSRTVLMSRPSPLWSSVTPANVKELSIQRPREVLAYLLNRLLDTDNGLKTTAENRFARYSQRIMLWNAMESHLDPQLMARLNYCLLEIDSNLGLHNIPAPDFLHTPQFIESLETSAGLSMLADLAKWHESQMKAFERKQHDLQLQAKWAKANRHTVVAHTRSWLENPQYARKPKAAPKPAAAKTPKSQAAKFLANLNSDLLKSLDSLMEAASHDVPEAPKVAVATPTVMPSGFKLNIIRKG